ncbi:MAG: nucleotidyltransferase domain-containing protein [Desulforhabdus sp.]|jgi:predicted nucleotidyltransferase|nr:nucleotidyltransferase domain-containing protein [Desulforhabdus sp.]
MNSTFHYCSASEKEAFLNALPAILEGFREIAFAYAYGSFIEEASFRDLDIALYLYPENLPHSKFGFEDKVAQQITNELNPTFPLDVRILNGASIAFQYNAIRGRLLMERAAEYRIRMVRWIIARYLDIKPVLNQHTREAFAVEPEP